MKLLTRSLLVGGALALIPLTTIPNQVEGVVSHERDCTYAATSRAGSVICFNGSGTYRARVKCLDGRSLFGPWKPVNEWSTVFCSPSTLVDLYIQFF